MDSNDIDVKHLNENLHQLFINIFNSNITNEIKLELKLILIEKFNYSLFFNEEETRHLLTTNAKFAYMYAKNNNKLWNINDAFERKVLLAIVSSAYYAYEYVRLNNFVWHAYNDKKIKIKALLAIASNAYYTYGYAELFDFAWHKYHNEEIKIKALLAIASSAYCTYEYAELFNFAWHAYNDEEIKYNAFTKLVEFSENEMELNFNMVDYSKRYATLFNLPFPLTKKSFNL